MDEDQKKLTIFGRIRRVVTKKLPAWAVLLILALVVGAYFLYKHSDEDHVAHHQMVVMFNYCLNNHPECKAMFIPPEPVKAVTPAPAPAPGK